MVPPKPNPDPSTLTKQTESKLKTQITWEGQGLEGFAAACHDKQLLQRVILCSGYRWKFGSLLVRHGKGHQFQSYNNLFLIQIKTTPEPSTPTPASPANPSPSSLLPKPSLAGDVTIVSFVTPPPSESSHALSTPPPLPAMYISPLLLIS